MRENYGTTFTLKTVIPDY